VLGKAAETALPELKLQHGRDLDRRGDPIKYIDLSLSNYATWPYDKVLLDGEVVGLSTFSGYSYNERSMLSLPIVEVDVPTGTEVTLCGARRAASRPSRWSSATSRASSARS
jgi:vanillate/3-O-methylgallate O-demethylase